MCVSPTTSADLFQKILQGVLVPQHKLVEQRNHINHVLAVCRDVHEEVEGRGQVGQHPAGKTLHLQKAKAVSLES